MANYSNYIETQTRKIISSYGGVGSIIETPKGALIIENFDKWPFFREINNLNADNFSIDDERLLERLRHNKGFPNLRAFLNVPTNVPHFKLRHKPRDKNKVLSSKYFPKWFYCNNCERFMPLNEWWKRWKDTLHKHNKRPEKSKFIPPVCFHCYDKAISNKSNNWKKYYYQLEQVRFVLTSPTGEIEDIPWERWPHAQKGVKDDDSYSASPTFDWDNLCCDNQNLRYIKSSKFSDLGGIIIKCANCKKNNTLSGLFGLRLPVKDKDKSYKKPVIRTSNSVYYPIIVNSIYLPTKKDIAPEDQESIEKYLENGKNIDFIYEALFGKYDKTKLKKFILGRSKTEYEPELSYRLKEFKFITNPERTEYPKKDDNTSGDLIFDQKKIPKLKELGIFNLTALKRIKITAVQTSYTRQEPLDKDVFLSGENTDDIDVRAKYTSKFGKNTKYLPAVENYGEGLFIALSHNKMKEWYNKVSSMPEFDMRFTRLWKNFQHNDFFPADKFSDKKHLTRFVLVHTLAHLLIKELEFICGYPSTSLNERLFIDNDEMQGLLIYTVAGTEGSYGGLVSQANERDFLKLLKSALVRATDCSSDPICYHSEDGQGIGGLNLAACYSCSLIPETACEEFNSFLDRALLIDEDFGFFDQLKVSRPTSKKSLAGQAVSA